MAVRIRNFGGVLQELAPGHPRPRRPAIVSCRTASRLAYLAPRDSRAAAFRLHKISGIDLAYSNSVSCTYREPSKQSPVQRRIYVEADGELLGTLRPKLRLSPTP